MKITIPYKIFDFKIELKTINENLKSLHITKDFTIIATMKSLLKIDCKNMALEQAGLKSLNIDFLELKKFIGQQKKDICIDIERMNEDCVFIAFHDKKGVKKGIIKWHERYIDYAPILKNFENGRDSHLSFHLSTSFSKLKLFKHALKILEIGKEAIQARLQHIRARVIMQEHKRLELQRSFYLAFKDLQGIDTSEGATWYIKDESKTENECSMHPFYIEQGNKLMVTMPSII